MKLTPGTNHTLYCPTCALPATGTFGGTFSFRGQSYSHFVDVHCPHCGAQHPEAFESGQFSSTSDCLIIDPGDDTGLSCAFFGFGLPVSEVAHPSEVIWQAIAVSIRTAREEILARGQAA